MPQDNSKGSEQPAPKLRFHADIMEAGEAALRNSRSARASIEAEARADSIQVTDDGEVLGEVLELRAVTATILNKRYANQQALELRDLLEEESAIEGHIAKVKERHDWFVDEELSGQMEYLDKWLAETR